MIFTPQLGQKKKEEGKDEEEKKAVHVIAKEDEAPRVMGLCGDLDEEKAGELIYGMISLYESGITYSLEDPEDEKSDIITSYKPFEFVISTLGGNAQEMFGLHDLMRVVREN